MIGTPKFLMGHVTTVREFHAYLAAIYAGYLFIWGFGLDLGLEGSVSALGCFWDQSIIC